MVVLLLLLGLARADDAAEAQGRKLYMANCMSCHGAAADGQGPAAAALRPRPTDFTAAAWWVGRTDEQVKAAIRTGSPGTPMMGFARLSESDLDQIVAFLRTKAAAE